MPPQVWLVTGTTSGLGKQVVLDLLQRGDLVIATGRNISARLGALQSPSLRLLELDISSDRTTLTAAVHAAWALFGHIDVLLNNAGMNQLSSAEEATDAHMHALLTTNLLGPIRLTQAILPLMRVRRSGTVAFISSSAAWTPLPFMVRPRPYAPPPGVPSPTNPRKSLYAASKSGLSAFVEALHKEIRPLGLRAVAIECGGFPTSLSQPRDNAPPPPPPTQLADYAPGMAALGGMFATDPAAYMPGDVAKGAARIVDVVKGETGLKWAVRVVLGSDAHAAVEQKVREVAGVLEEWKGVGWSTDTEGGKGGATREYLEAVSILDGEGEGE